MLCYEWYSMVFMVSLVNISIVDIEKLWSQHADSEVDLVIMIIGLATELRRL